MGGQGFLFGLRGGALDLVDFYFGGNLSELVATFHIIVILHIS